MYPVCNVLYYLYIYSGSTIFKRFCIIACQLAWFIPITVFDIAKYGWTNPIPVPDIFMQLGLILLSIWAGSKIAIKILYEKN